MTRSTPAPRRGRRHAPALLAVLTSPRTVWRYFWSRETSVWPKLGIFLAAAYVILPVDLIPDVAPILGWLDDAGAVGVATGWVASELSRFADRQAATREVDEDEVRPR